MNEIRDNVWSLVAVESEPNHNKVDFSDLHYLSKEA